MSDKNFKILLNVFLITGSLYFIFIGLTSGKSFLIPLVTAIILSMVMAPVAAKFREWGVGQGLAVLFADLIVVAFIAFMIFLLVAQANQIQDNWPQIERRMKPKIEQAQQFFSNKLNMPLGSEQQSQQPDTAQQTSVAQLQQQNQQQQSSVPGISPTQEQQKQGLSPLSFNIDSIRDKLGSIVKNVFSFISNLLLVLIYIFFFMFYKDKFKNSIIGMVPEEKREQTADILDKTARAAQKYLFGRFLLIAILAALYMTGWSIIGLKYAIFISLIAALFSLIPYVGNLIGLVLAIAMSFLSGDGGIGQIIAILAVYSVVQFIESYLLEPYIVGHEVDLNPVMIIVGVVLGGIIWGVMGMILAIPVLAIMRVVFDNIKSLRPLGYVFDERDLSSGDSKQDKVKKWIKDKAKKTGIKKK